MVFHPHRDQTVGDLKHPTKTYKNANKAGSSSLKRQDAPNLEARSTVRLKYSEGGYKLKGVERKCSEGGRVPLRGPWGNALDMQMLAEVRAAPALYMFKFLLSSLQHQYHPSKAITFQ